MCVLKKEGKEESLFPLSHFYKKKSQKSLKLVTKLNESTHKTQKIKEKLMGYIVFPDFMIDFPNWGF